MSVPQPQVSLIEMSEIIQCVHVRLSNKSIRENFETTHASLTEIDRISIVSNKRNVLFFYFPVFRHKQKT